MNMQVWETCDTGHGVDILVIIMWRGEGGRETCAGSSAECPGRHRTQGNKHAAHSDCANHSAKGATVRTEQFEELTH